MAATEFTGEIARLQRVLSQSPDMVKRRSIVLETLNLGHGERVLEIGCGGGDYAFEAAHAVGSTGRVCAVDVSPDQLDAARQRCADLPWVECREANAIELPFADEEFDVVYFVKVLEYIEEIDLALKQVRRVLRPGGRVVILATNWGSLVWYSTQPERMRVLVAVDEHAPHRDLPAELPTRLHDAGFLLLHQTPVPVLNLSYNENSYSYCLSRLISMSAVGGGRVGEEEAQAWLDELAELSRQKKYFFSSSSFLTEAQKPH